MNKPLFKYLVYSEPPEVEDSQRPGQEGLGEHLGRQDELMLVQINAVSHC